MLSHDFQDMPSRDVRTIGADPYDTVNVLRCRWCMKTPAKAREGGCAIHELEEVGQILLGAYNPDGIGYFKDRTCVTCKGPIMMHWLRRGSTEYWCYEDNDQSSDGVSGCVHDVSGVQVPVEETGTRGSI